MGKRVIAIPSGGRHFIQLLRASPAWDDHDVSIATVDTLSRALARDLPLFTFSDVSRADWWRIPAARLDIAAILLKVRRQVITTTSPSPVPISRFTNPAFTDRIRAFIES